MANSKIIINWSTVPNIDEVLNITESHYSLSLDETFKTERLEVTQVTIPSQNLYEYSLTISYDAITTGIGVKYFPEGGAWTSAPLNSLLKSDNLDGTYTYKLNSKYQVVIYQISTGNSIVWGEGEFVYTGEIEDSFEGFVSTNYASAFNIDYNPTGLFTVTSTTGPVGSGLGSVEIIANYPGATFSVSQNTCGATITILNEVVEVETSVTPTIEFEINSETINPGTKSINIITNHYWELISELPAWLEIVGVSGTGSGSTNVNPYNYSLMPDGNYTYTAIYLIDGEQYEVLITLKLTKKIKHPFIEGNLYFTKEDVSVGFSSIVLNSYVNFDITIKTFEINSNEEKVYNRQYNFPLLKGKGAFYVGEIVDGLLDEIQYLSEYIPDFKSNYVKKQIRPAEVSISYQEKKYNDNSLIISGNIEMFKMIKGFRPFMSSNQLGLLTVSQQEITRITSKSVIGTSFVYIGKPRIVVKKNNQVIEDFEVDDSDTEIIYSYYRFINFLKPGDSIEIIIINGLETRSQRFLVFKNGLENTFLFFENQNGMIEPYEFTGRRRIISNLKFTSSTKIKNRFSFEKKEISDNKQTLIINTGQLLKTDHKIITNILKSQNVWCSFNGSEGPYVLIDALTTKLTNQDTESSEEDFDIEFNILENADASIYPQ